MYLFGPLIHTTSHYQLCCLRSLSIDNFVIPGLRYQCTINTWWSIYSFNHAICHTFYVHGYTTSWFHPISLAWIFTDEEIKVLRKNMTILMHVPFSLTVRLKYLSRRCYQMVMADLFKRCFHIGRSTNWKLPTVISLNCLRACRILVILKEDKSYFTFVVGLKRAFKIFYQYEIDI